jgi:hypothetical protein
MGWSCGVISPASPRSPPGNRSRKPNLEASCKTACGGHMPAPRHRSRMSCRNASEIMCGCSVRWVKDERHPRQRPFMAEGFGHPAPKLSPRRKLRIASATSRGFSAGTRWLACSMTRCRALGMRSAMICDSAGGAAGSSLPAIARVGTTIRGRNSVMSVRSNTARTH